jgi:hypothetical protein
MDQESASLCYFGFSAALPLDFGHHPQLCCELRPLHGLQHNHNATKIQNKHI